jgi:hypothetical protein
MFRSGRFEKGDANGKMDEKKTTERHGGYQMAANLPFLILNDSTEADGTNVFVRQNVCNDLGGK